MRPTEARSSDAISMAATVAGASLADRPRPLTLFPSLLIDPERSAAQRNEVEGGVSNGNKLLRSRQYIFRSKAFVRKGFQRFDIRSVKYYSTGIEPRNKKTFGLWFRRSLKRVVFADIFFQVVKIIALVMLGTADVFMSCKVLYFPKIIQL